MLCNQHPLFNLQHCVLLFIWVILLLSHSTQGPRWFCMWVLLGASQLCVASLSARPSWVSPQAGQDITMSHRWLMAVLSQGLMTSSLVFSFVSPVISVSKQKREAMCSMCDPTLLHRCRHTEEEKHEWTSFLLFMFLLHWFSIKRQSSLQLHGLMLGSTGLPQPTSNRAHAEHFSHLKHTFKLSLCLASESEYH